MPRAATPADVRSGPPTAVWVVLAACAGIATPAAAQKTYELTKEGLKEVEAPEPGTPLAELEAVRKALAKGNPARAQEKATAWLERYPNHARRSEAYLLRGDAKAAQHDYYQALFDYESLLRRFPESPHFRTALRREFHIARAFARGLNRQLWGLRILPADGEAEELFIRIQERAPGSELAERAGIELGDLYYRQADMKLAAEAYDLFLENYPDSQWREYAMLRQIMANLANFKGPRFDMTGLLEARNRLQTYKETFPAGAEEVGVDALLTRIEETMVRRTLLVAGWYEGRGEQVSARTLYRRLLDNHPRSAAAQTALRRLRAITPGDEPAKKERKQQTSGEGDRGTAEQAGKSS